MKKGDPCEQKGIFPGNEFCEIWTKLHGWFGWCIGPEKKIGVSQNFGWSPSTPTMVPKNWSERMVQRTKKIHVPGFFCFDRVFFLQGPFKRFKGTNTFEFALSEFGLKKCGHGAKAFVWCHPEARNKPWLHFPSEQPCILEFMEIQVSGKFGGDGQKVSLEEIHVVLKILEKTSTCYKTL